MNRLLHARLYRWGRWVVRSASRSLGYPPVSPGFSEYMPRCGKISGVVPVEVMHAMRPGGEDELSAAIDRLEVRLKQVCYEYYVVTGKHDEVARRLSVSRKTLYLWLDRLHKEIYFTISSEKA